MPYQTHARAASQPNELNELSFQFYEQSGDDKPALTLVVARVDSEDSLGREQVFEKHKPLAEAIESQKDYPGAELLILGHVCPSDDLQMYWSNEDGWVDRESATTFNLREAVSGAFTLFGATGIELASATPQ